MKIEATPRGLITVLFRQFWVALLVFALCFGASIYYVIKKEPVYQSSGSVLVKFGQNAMPDTSLSGDNRSREISANDRDEVMQSNIGILNSHNLLQKVVNDIGADTLYPGLTEMVSGRDTPTEAAIKNLRAGDLEVGSGTDSNIIEIHLKNGNPQVAANFVQQLMDAFIKRQSEVYSLQAKDFLQKQILEADAQLESSQAELQTFKEENGISDLDGEMQQLLAQKKDLTSIAFEALTEAQAKLAELQVREVEMMATYRSDSPIMKKMRDSVAVARRLVEQRKRDMDAIKRQGSDLNNKVATIDERVSYLETLRPRYNELMRQVNIDEENLRFYQLRSEEARANTILNQENITRIAVVDAPVVTMKPIRPRKKLIIIMGFLAGGLFGLGLAVLRELLDDRFSAPEQVQAALGLPVLETFGARG